MITISRNYTFTVVTISGDEQNLRRQSTTFSANYTTEVTLNFIPCFNCINLYTGRIKENK